MPIPSARRHLAGVVVDHRLYALGGFTRMGRTSSTVYVYDPTEDSWTEGASLPTPRGALAAVVHGGSIYAIGGWDAEAGDRAANERYDPSTGQWAVLSPLPTPRNLLAAAAHEGSIYAFGGARKDTAVDVVEIYDVRADHWRSASPMPLPLRAPSAVSLGHFIYVFGGTTTGFTPELRAEVWRYDPGGDEWELSPSAMPTPRHGMAAVLLEDRIFLIGGGDEVGFHPSRANEVYLP